MALRKLLILPLLLAVGAAGLLLLGAGRRVGVSQGYSPVQPIAFSHKIHAGDNHVPCLYCHFAAEKGRHAGIPPENVCMNCHSRLRVESAEVEKLKEAVAQGRAIRWTKIHNLPDFVYFNHSQHVLAKVACQSCHGPVEQMVQVRQEAPLTMGWCLGCHRQRGITPPSWRKVALQKPTALPIGGTDCSKCHY